MTPKNIRNKEYIPATSKETRCISCSMTAPKRFESEWSKIGSFKLPVFTYKYAKTKPMIKV